MRVVWLKMVIFASFARHIFRTFTSKAAFIILCYVARALSGSSMIGPTEIE